MTRRHQAPAGPVSHQLIRSASGCTLFRIQPGRPHQTVATLPSVACSAAGRLLRSAGRTVTEDQAVLIQVYARLAEEMDDTVRLPGLAAVVNSLHNPADALRLLSGPEAEQYAQWLRSLA